MNAYRVWMAPSHEHDLLVYADTPGKAKFLSLDGPWSWAYWDFVHLRARRVPQYDHPNPPHKIVETNKDLATGLEPFYDENPQH